MQGLFLAARNIPLIANETISNYLRQVLSISSEQEAELLRKTIGDSRIAQCSPLYPPNLQALRELIPSLPDATHMVRNNTGVDVMRLTVSPVDYDRFYSHSMFGDRQPIAVLSGITKNRSKRGPTERYFTDAVCPECMEPDRISNGRTFVRRQWAYSKITVCTEHRVSLTTACELCRHSKSYQDSLHRLHRLCVCGKSPLVNRAGIEGTFEFESDLRVADALDSLFSLAKEAHLDVRHTRYVYRRQALQLGFLTSRYQYDKIRELAGKKLHPDVIAKHEMKFAKGSAAAQMLRGNDSLRSPLENAVLVSTMFDSSAEFEYQMRAAGELSDEELLTPVCNNQWRPLSYSNKNLELLKQRVRDYVRSNPDASRSDIQRKLAYVFNRLRQHEPESIEGLLPSKKPCRNGGSRTSDAHKLEDQQFEAYVRRRYADFAANPPIFRVTKAKLKEGWRGAGSFPVNEWRLPLTSAALDDLQELTEQYRRRRGIKRRGPQSTRPHQESE